MTHPPATPQPAPLIDPPPRHGNALKAVIYLLLSVLCFDLMSILVRVMLTHGYSAQELSAYRNVLGVIPSVALMLWTGELRLRGPSLRIRQWKLAFLRGLAVAVAQLVFYTALGYLELATVSALAQTNALFVVILSMLILGERVGIWRWSAVAIGFVGAMWILRPGSEAFSPYAILPIIAAACYAYSVISVRQFDREVSNALLYLYSAISAALGAIVLAFFTTDFTPIASLADAGVIFALAIAGGVGVLFLMLAYRAADPSLLAPFGYFGILSAFVFGWLFFGEAPVDTLFPGVLLVVGAGSVIIWRENRWRIRRPGAPER